MDGTNPQGSGQDPQAGGQQPNQPQGKSIEQLDAERRTAITEAIKNNQEAVAAKKEAEYLRDLNRVLRNPQELMSINEKNPEHADKLAREAFGKSFVELLNAAQGGDSSQVAAENAARKVIQEEKQREAQKQMQDSIDKFYVDNGILPGTETYRKMQKEFQDYSPANIGAAIGILDMLRNKYEAQGSNGPKANPPMETINAMPQPGARNVGYQKVDNGQKPPPTPEQQGVMNQLGVTQADWQKYSPKS